MPTKRCRGCATTKPATAFARRAASPDGLQGRCNKCRADYRKANREAILAQGAAYRQANAADISAWHAANYARNKAAITARNDAYVATPRGRAVRRAKDQRRRARLRNVDCGCATGPAIAALWEAASDRCYVCGAPAEHTEHLTALAAGGRHCVSNLRPACARCNLRKGGRRSVTDLVQLLISEGVVVRFGVHEPGPACPGILISTPSGARQVVKE